MNKKIALGLTLCTCLTASSAFAFMEEGLNDPSKTGYKKCKNVGDLRGATIDGCNPWPDWDANYSYQASQDMKKNSVHFNATQALAISAGFDPCAAFIVALWDEAADVATDTDLRFWAPFPANVSATGACANLLAAEKVQVIASTVDGRMGGLVSPLFTHRAFLNKNTSEVARESHSFHFNHADVNGTATHTCSAAPDPGPSQPSVAGAAGTFADMVTLPELRDWAMADITTTTTFVPMADCRYIQTDGTAQLGPLTTYKPDADGPVPGSLGALGTFLHSQQDFWSHKTCQDTTHGFGINTSLACGFASSHYGGEFGAINGKPGAGSIKIKTPMNTYTVGLHSSDTVSALTQSYTLLKEYLDLNPDLVRPGAVACSDASMLNFANTLAMTVNYVPSNGAASGAKKRSDMADSLAKSQNCTFVAQ